MVSFHVADASEYFALTGNRRRQAHEEGVGVRRAAVQEVQHLAGEL